MVVVALCSGTVLLPVVLLHKLDAIIKKDYLQILQRRLKSAARWLKLVDCQKLVDDYPKKPQITTTFKPIINIC